MLLAIDIGNSNILCGIYKKDELVATFRLESDQSRTEDEFSTQIIGCLSNLELDYRNIKGIIISSTTMAINPIFEKMCLKYFNTKPMFVGPNIKSGVIIKIEHPKTLGPDILVGIVAAKNKYGLECLVVDLGTATTMTIINDKNEYIGGIVYPGIKTSIKALAQNTATLPVIDLEVPDKIICGETVQALQAGLMYGYASMLDGMIEKMEAEYGKKLKVIFTGGLASKIVDIVKRDVILDEDLLLDGLKYLYDKNIVKSI